MRERGREGGHCVTTSFSPAAAARWLHMSGPTLQGGCLPHRMLCSSPSWPGWRWKPQRVPLWLPEWDPPAGQPIIAAAPGDLPHGVPDGGVCSWTCGNSPQHPCRVVKDTMGQPTPPPPNCTSAGTWRGGFFSFPWMSPTLSPKPRLISCRSGKGLAHRCVAWNKFTSHSESLCLHLSRKLLNLHGSSCRLRGCCPDLPHTQWLQTTEMYSSYSSGSQKSELRGTGRGWLCLEAPGGEAVLPSPSGGCLRPWLVATPLHSLPPSSHSHLPYILQVALCKPLLRTLMITFGAQPQNRESLCISQTLISAVGPAV